MALSRSTVNTGELARLLLLTTRHVGKLVADGVLVKAKDQSGHELRGRFDSIENTQNYIRFIRDNRGLDDPGETKFSQSRNRRMDAEAKMAELRYAKLKGEVVTKVDVETMVTDMVTRCKSRLLAMPDRISRLLIGLKTFRKIYTIIRADLEQCLGELRFDLNSITPHGRNGEDEKIDRRANRKS